MVVDTFIFYYRINQNHSLMGIRWKNFSDVLASYSIVKKVGINLPKNLFHLLMQRELRFVLGWYSFFKGTVEDKAVMREMKEQLKIFFGNFEKEDVTASFLRNELNVPDFSFLHEIVSPEITVIMPVYNAEKSIRYALYSLQKQSFSDYEVVCINDASTDSSLAILEECAKKDYRIRIINNIKNLHAGVSRNLAMQLARGTYIVFLDADDALREDALEKFNEKAQVTDADCIVCQMYNANEVLDFSLQARYLPPAACFSATDISDYLFNFTSAGVGGKCVKRSFREKNDIRFSSLARSEDVIFWYKALIKAGKIAVIKEPLYQIDTVINPASLEHSKDKTPLLFWEAITEVNRMIKENGAYEIYKRSLINAHIQRCVYNINMLSKCSDFTILKVKKLFSDVGLEKEIDRELELHDHKTDYFFVPQYVLLLRFLDISYEDFTKDYTLKQKKISKRLENELRKVKRALNNVRNNTRFANIGYMKWLIEDLVLANLNSCKGGRIFLFFLQKGLDVIRCYRGYGFAFTLNRVIERVKSNKSIFKNML